MFLREGVFVRERKQLNCLVYPGNKEQLDTTGPHGWVIGTGLASVRLRDMGPPETYQGAVIQGTSVGL